MPEMSTLLEFAQVCRVCSSKQWQTRLALGKPWPKMSCLGLPKFTKQTLANSGKLRKLKQTRRGAGGELLNGGVA